MTCDKWKPRQRELFAACKYQTWPVEEEIDGLCRYFSAPKTCNLPSVFMCETYGRRSLNHG